MLIVNQDGMIFELSELNELPSVISEKLHNGEYKFV